MTEEVEVDVKTAVTADDVARVCIIMERLPLGGFVVSDADIGPEGNYIAKEYKIQGCSSLKDLQECLHSYVNEWERVAVEAIRAEKLRLRDEELRRNAHLYTNVTTIDPLPRVMQQERASNPSHDDGIWGWLKRRRA